LKQSKIIVGKYEIDSNQKIILKNGVKIKLTEKEMQLILALHNKNGIQKNILLKKIWNYNSDLESHTFETNLHRLRKKIERNFKDSKFIIEKNSLYYLNN
jgi:DNA-binding response OmpR family regulator